MCCWFNKLPKFSQKQSLRIKFSILQLVCEEWLVKLEALRIVQISDSMSISIIGWLFWESISQDRTFFSQLFSFIIIIISWRLSWSRRWLLSDMIKQWLLMMMFMIFRNVSSPTCVLRHYCWKSKSGPHCYGAPCWCCPEDSRSDDCVLIIFHLYHSNTIFCHSSYDSCQLMSIDVIRYAFVQIWFWKITIKGLE